MSSTDHTASYTNTPYPHKISDSTQPCTQTHSLPAEIVPLCSHFADAYRGGHGRYTETLLRTILPTLALILHTAIFFGDRSSDWYKILRMGTARRRGAFFERE